MMEVETLTVKNNALLPLTFQVNNDPPIELFTGKEGTLQTNDKTTYKVFVMGTLLLTFDGEKITTTPFYDEYFYQEWTGTDILIYNMLPGRAIGKNVATQPLIKSCWGSERPVTLRNFTQQTMKVNAARPMILKPNCEIVITGAFSVPKIITYNNYKNIFSYVPVRQGRFVAVLELGN